MAFELVPPCSQVVWTTARNSIFGFDCWFLPRSGFQPRSPTDLMNRKSKSNFQNFESSKRMYFSNRAHRKSTDHKSTKRADERFNRSRKHKTCWSRQQIDNKCPPNRPKRQQQNHDKCPKVDLHENTNPTQVVKLFVIQMAIFIFYVLSNHSCLFYACSLLAIIVPPLPTFILTIIPIYFWNDFLP